VALTLTGAGAVYGAGTRYARRALSGVDLVVEPGDLVLVLGATGSGKSTLLRAAAAVLPLSEGTVDIDGTPVGAPASDLRERRIGLVFQDPETQLFADTVLEDVSFGPRNLDSDDPARDARAAIRRVGLDPDAFADRSPFTLSGGEARRVAMAGVLAMDPAYLLMDEPTAGLDASGRAAVLEAMRSAREHAGIVVVTHDAEELLAYADHVVILVEGKTAYSGPAAQLVRDPSPFAAAGLLAPDVLAIQEIALSRGAVLPAFALDPQIVADRLERAVEAGELP
jgi:energy-coupling factor transport system ATP-binding protein